MSKIKLNARQRGKEKQGLGKEIPAVVYGPNSENINLAIDAKEFNKAYHQAGESTLIELAVENQEPIKVLIHAVQRNPVNDQYIHVDFYQLAMNKKLVVEVELRFTGIEEVEKASQGEVTRNMDVLEVECLPKNLVKEIEVDIRKKLKEIGDVLNAKDIKLPAGLVLVTDPEASIISVQKIKEEIFEEPKKEEAPAAGETEEKKEEVQEGDTKPEGNKKEDKTT
ncbi:50S ribosomal protein L25 [Candidatus Kuenenbacteria bacterium CG_4_9_14_3_um_filter_39_14]|uniref:Large ribosomal subunit protein bL25 n=6 Tax=Candidatus Kueneniibacteriota TaxID=1752740 RepID=A0A2M7ILP4_9BACT|nr:MAG: 50S ribosomal protein L25 [Candidatus Kuenenbacteria bacterium CG23_combo_of_CG06-09_8_20_14_all_39_39]PIP75427.1 MAG: 50S ribosomal protein L25 [Candidatus Kuenenbacteria bacterium CG22_combo_CG10-13_8_21_14_all_39_9]PIR81117.1 MAG: 50S ribosomal protein L25 [Candidatus Kuenenbacteria bacterium CG10_big_fil_rev_8_21_14_0_10_39_14]PIW95700.1 MAG: 50S ribosomal protein L25 [Candidatus Kuenenbacteria bacterium CG_4_8_14_3_um_filter_39_15]PIX92303.1 MAG: 50S ribosomal protein L25 [Candidat